MYKEKYFALAFELAERGRGKCSPNPFVGAVIVKDGKIVGKGFTQPYGKDHAEVQAIKDAGKKCRNAEMYVTLEPCAHFGKTPPCADAIVKAGIKKVYAGIQDPNPLVNGKGFKKLKDAGIELKTGIWKDKIEKQIEYYLTYITKKRPFVFMKNAVSLDGKIATETGDAKWISGDKSRERTHLLRNEADVVLTGIGTVLQDDPLLNVRFPKTSEQSSDSLAFKNFQTAEAVHHPTRAILDSNLRISLDSKIVQTAEDIKTIIFVGADLNDKYGKIEKLTAKNIEIVKISITSNGLNLSEILSALYQRNYYSVMLEAGSRICSSFLREKLVDKIYYFVAPKIVGGNFSLFRELKIESMNEAVMLKIDSLEKSGEDILIIGYPNYLN